MDVENIRDILGEKLKNGVMDGKTSKFCNVVLKPIFSQKIDSCLSVSVAKDSSTFLAVEVLMEIKSATSKNT